MDTSGHEQPLKDFDNLTREALSRILGTPLTDLQWAQACLPIGLGGMGLRAAQDHAAGAYAASFLSVQPLVRDILGIDPMESIPPALSPALLGIISAKQDAEVTTDALDGIPQRKISEAIDLNNHKLLFNKLTREGGVRETGRLASLGLDRAGDWLFVAPCPALGLHLRGQEFTAVAKYRLGCPIYARAGPCPACGEPSDVLGDHAMHCGTSGERIARHNALRDSLHATAVSAALGPIREGRFILPGNERRPADIMVPRWTRGQDTAWDVTVVSPLQQATINQAGTDPGCALTMAFDRKVKAVGEQCRQQGVAFIPLAVESLGGWHPTAVAELNKLASALSRHTGQDGAEASRFLFGKLSIQLMRGNAALFVNRIPEFPPPHVDGIL